MSCQVTHAPQMGQRVPYSKIDLWQFRHRKRWWTRRKMKRRRQLEWKVSRCLWTCSSCRYCHSKRRRGIKTTRSSKEGCRQTSSKRGGGMETGKRRGNRRKIRSTCHHPRGGRMSTTRSQGESYNGPFFCPTWFGYRFDTYFDVIDGKYPQYEHEYEYKYA